MQYPMMLCLHLVAFYIMKKNRKDWFKARGYLHLTNKISPQDRKKITQLVSNPNWVARYAFYPFLHKKIPQRRYKINGYDLEGKPIRGHKKEKNGRIISNKKLRPIHYANHLDAQIYAYYSSEIIQLKYEEYLSEYPELSDCISAYRRVPTEDGLSNKNNIHFAKDVFDHIRNIGECCALAFDIESFFTNLNHKHLKRAWSQLLGLKSLPKDHYNIFKAITNYSYINLSDFRDSNKNFDEKRLADNRKEGVHGLFLNGADFRQQLKEGKFRIYKNQYHDEYGNLRGILQGLPISATLANLYLLEFDKAVFEKIVVEAGGFYRRYSDDIVVICQKDQYQGLMKFIVKKIQEYHLKISESKTEICFFNYEMKNKVKTLVPTKLVAGHEKHGFPFRYLGFEFYGDKVLLKSSNLAKFYRRMKSAVKSKTKRLRHHKEKFLDDSPPLYKRRLERIYTRKGLKSRAMQQKVTRYVRDETKGIFIPTFINIERRYRGNYFSYVERAARIMEEPAIIRQTRNAWKIYKKTWKQRLKEQDIDLNSRNEKK